MRYFWICMTSGSIRMETNIVGLCFSYHFAKRNNQVLHLIDFTSSCAYGIWTKYLPVFVPGTTIFLESPWNVLVLVQGQRPDKSPLYFPYCKMLAPDKEEMIQLTLFMSFLNSMELQRRKQVQSDKHVVYSMSQNKVE